MVLPNRIIYILNYMVLELRFYYDKYIKERKRKKHMLKKLCMILHPS